MTTHKMPCSISDGPETPEDVLSDWEKESDQYIYEQLHEQQINDRIQHERGNTMLLVGITGKAGAGKDTVGEILRDVHSFGITSLAHPIKAAISAMLDSDPEMWNDRAWKETVLPGIGRTPRYLAQTLGTEWGRNCVGSTLWVNLTLKRIDFMEWERIVITDVRFDNEAEMIRDKGIIIHIYRDVDEYIDNTGHSSEGGVTPGAGDLHIYNNASRAHLSKEIGRIMPQIFSKERKRT